MFLNRTTSVAREVTSQPAPLPKKTKVSNFNLLLSIYCVPFEIILQPAPLPKKTKMKIALIFLSVLVAVTHQQFQRQRERLWWSPYYYPSQPSISNYQRVYQNLQDDIQPDYRRFRPTRPIVYSEDDEFSPNLVPTEYQDNTEEDEYPDIHSRAQVYRQRRPVFPKRPQDQRFLLSYLNFKTTTATFTVTSSLTLTTVQSCIAAAKFLDDTAKTTACRRKRDLLDSNNPDDMQFAIDPTETQRVMPTALPSLEMNRGSRQESADQYISASKRVSPSDISGSISWMRGLSEPRFLNSYSVVSTTITTFSFSSTTVTKTVAIGGDAAVLCLPTGWTVC